MKVKTLLTITLLLCFAMIASNGQNKEQHEKHHKKQGKKRISEFNVGVGLAAHSILDEGYAAFAFNSINPNLNLSYQRDKNNNRMEFGLDAVVGSTNYNDYKLFKTSLIDVNLYALYARRLNLNNEKMQLHLGGIADYDILFLLNMPEEYDVGNVSYTVATSLGLYVGYDYQINEKNKASINFKHPLISNVVRNPYTGYNQTTALLTDYGDNLPPLIFHNPQLTHGFKFFRPSLELEWERKISQKTTLVPKLSIEYLNYNSINPIKYFRTNLSIGINF